MNWAWMAGALTVMIGSLGKTGGPSGTAQMSPVNLKPRRKARNYSLKQSLVRR